MYIAMVVRTRERGFAERGGAEGAPQDGARRGEVQVEVLRGGGFAERGRRGERLGECDARG